MAKDYQQVLTCCREAMCRQPRSIVHATWATYLHSWCDHSVECNAYSSYVL